MTDPNTRAEAECEDSVPARPQGPAQGFPDRVGPAGLARPVGSARHGVRPGLHDRALWVNPKGMRQYRGPADPAARHRAARLTVLSGPSAVGKSTVIEAIRRHNPEVWLSISVTTRRPRPGEVHGREYYFVAEPEFKEMAAAGELLEWARYAGNFYGTPRGPVAERLEAGIASLLEVDVVGARQVRAAVPGALLVFLAPPSWDELVRRLTGRGTESSDVIGQRLEAAKEELQAENEFDITLINTSVKDVCAQLVALMTAQPVELSA